MPIAGLTDRSGATGGFPLIGKLFKGGPKRERTGNSGEKYEIFGEDLDHFRFMPKGVPENEADKSPIAMDFISVYGKMPRQIAVYLPYDDVDANFPTWWEIYKGGRLTHRGDGITASLWWDVSQKKYRRDPIPFPEKEVNGKKVATQSGTLHLLLPDMWAKGHIGIITLTTHSIHDILRIHSALTAYQALSRNSLKGIRFNLVRYVADVIDPESKRREKWLVGVQPDTVWAMAQIASSHKEAYAMLEAPSPGEVSYGDDLADDGFIDQDTGEIIDVTPPPVAPVPTPAPAKAKGKKENPVVADAATQAKLNRLHQLGTWLYHTLWDTNRGLVCSHVSGGAKTSSKELTAKELGEAVELLEKKWKRVTDPDATTCIGTISQHVIKANPLLLDKHEKLAAMINTSEFKAGSDPKPLLQYLLTFEHGPIDRETLHEAVSGLYAPEQEAEEAVEF